MCVLFVLHCTASTFVCSFQCTHIHTYLCGPVCSSRCHRGGELSQECTGTSLNDPYHIVHMFIHVRCDRYVIICVFMHSLCLSYIFYGLPVCSISGSVCV